MCYASIKEKRLVFASKYVSLSHLKSRIRYYFVVSAKYRRKCFEGIEDDVKRVFGRSIEKCGKVKLLSVGVDKDHVYFIVQAEPNVSASQIVSRVKQLTARLFWQEYEEVLSRFYWGNKKGGNYGRTDIFVKLLENISEDKILEYIENQGNE